MTNYTLALCRIYQPRVSFVSGKAKKKGFEALIIGVFYYVGLLVKAVTENERVNN